MGETAGLLIVEDRGIIAAAIRHQLEQAGFVIAGMAADLARACALAKTLPLHGAVLDVDLGGEFVYPVAEILLRRRIPFLFLTGYGRAAIPAPWQRVHLLEKPFEAEALIKTLRLALTGNQAEPLEERIMTPAILSAWDRIRHTRDLLTEQRACGERPDFGHNHRG